MPEPKKTNNQPPIFYGCTELFYDQKNDKDGDESTHAWKSNDGNVFADRGGYPQGIAVSINDGDVIAVLEKDISKYSAVYIDPSETNIRKKVHLFKNGEDIGKPGVKLQRYLNDCSPSSIPAAPLPKKMPYATITLDDTKGEWKQLSNDQYYTFQLSDHDKKYVIKGYSLELKGGKCEVDIQINNRRYKTIFETNGGTRITFLLYFNKDVPLVAAGQYKGTPTKQNVFLVDTNNAGEPNFMAQIRKLVTPAEANAFYNEIKRLPEGKQVEQARLFIIIAQSSKKEENEEIETLMAEIRRLVTHAEADAFQNEIKGLPYEKQVEQARLFIIIAKSSKEEEHKEIDTLMAEIRKLVTPAEANAFQNEIKGLPEGKQLEQARLFIIIAKSSTEEKKKEDRKAPAKEAVIQKPTTKKEPPVALSEAEEDRLRSKSVNALKLFKGREGQLNFNIDRYNSGRMAFAEVKEAYDALKKAFDALAEYKKVTGFDHAAWQKKFIGDEKNFKAVEKDEKKRVEDAKKAEDKRVKEAKKDADTAKKKADEAKKADDAKKEEEARKKAEETKKKAEDKRAKEAKKDADTAKKKETEEAKKAEENEKAAAKKAKEDEAKKAEETKKVEEAKKTETERLAKEAAEAETNTAKLKVKITDSVLKQHYDSTKDLLVKYRRVCVDVGLIERAKKEKYDFKRFDELATHFKVEILGLKSTLSTDEERILRQQIINELDFLKSALSLVKTIENKAAKELDLGSYDSLEGINIKAENIASLNTSIKEYREQNIKTRDKSHDRNLKCPEAWIKDVDSRVKEAIATMKSKGAVVVNKEAEDLLIELNKADKKTVTPAQLKAWKETKGYIALILKNADYMASVCKEASKALFKIDGLIKEFEAPPTAEAKKATDDEAKKIEDAREKAEADKKAQKDAEKKRIADDEAAKKKADEEAAAKKAEESRPKNETDAKHELDESKLVQKRTYETRFDGALEQMIRSNNLNDIMTGYVETVGTDDIPRIGIRIDGFYGDKYSLDNILNKVTEYAKILTSVLEYAQIGQPPVGTVQISITCEGNKCEPLTPEDAKKVQDGLLGGLPKNKYDILFNPTPTSRITKEDIERHEGAIRDILKKLEDLNLKKKGDLDKAKQHEWLLDDEYKEYNDDVRRMSGAVIDDNIRKRYDKIKLAIKDASMERKATLDDEETDARGKKMADRVKAMKNVQGAVYVPSVAVQAGQRIKNARGIILVSLVIDPKEKDPEASDSSGVCQGVRVRSEKSILDEIDARYAKLFSFLRTNQKYIRNIMVKSHKNIFDGMTECSSKPTHTVGALEKALTSSNNGFLDNEVITDFFTQTSYHSSQIIIAIFLNNEDSSGTETLMSKREIFDGLVLEKIPKRKGHEDFLIETDLELVITAPKNEDPEE